MPVYMTNSQKPAGSNRKYGFLILWLIGHALAWGGYFLALDMFRVDFLWLIALALGGITSLVQYVLIRWQFGRNLKWWLPVSLLTWLFAAFVPFNASMQLGSSQLDITIQALALFGPAALVQAIMLRKQVQNSWLWLLASVAGTATFALSVSAMDWLPISGYVGYGAYAGTTALTLLWLFGMSGQQMAEVDTDYSYHRLSDRAEYEDRDYEDLRRERESRRRLMR